MRRIRIALASVALAAMGLIGTAAPASASCSVLIEELGCTESIPCRVAANFGIHLDCIQ